MKYTYDEVLAASLEYFDNDELAAKVFTDKYALRDLEGNFYEKTPEDLHRRLAKEFARIESKYPNSLTEDQIFSYLDRFKWVIPQGSPMSAIGNNFQIQTLGNCYVLDPPLDSYGGILKSDQELAQLMKRRAGVGLSLDNLRPKGMVTRNSAKTTDGIGVFMERFSNTCREVAQCIAEGERVLTKAGLKAIESCVPGVDQVWTKKGWVLIKDVLANGKKQTWKVTSRNGFSIKTSPDHIFLTEQDGDIKEVRIKDLAVGNTVVIIPGTHNRNEKEIELSKNDYVKKGLNLSNRRHQGLIFPKTLNKDLAYLIGYAYGDGFVRRDKFNEPISLFMACGHAWPRIEDKLSKIIKETFSCEAKSGAGDGAVNTLAIHSKEICSFIQVNGLLKDKAHEITIPIAVFNSPAYVQMAFLAGFFDADGYNSGKKKGYVFSTACREFAESIQLLLMANGIVSKVHVEDRSDKGWRNLNSVCVTGSHAQSRLTELMGASVKVQSNNFVAKRDNYTTPFKAQTLGFKRSAENKFIPDGPQLVSVAAYLKASPIFGVEDEVLISDKVVKVEDAGETDTYDLVLESEHLFWCEGFYVHNSGRRGAEMQMLSVHHPDIETFITIKKNPTKVTGANISVKLTDEFMSAVVNDTEYEQRWPVESKTPALSKKVSAKKIWDMIIEAAWDSAEPGLFFIDNQAKFTPADIYGVINKDWKSTATNPCGEIGMGVDSCRLMVVNLFSFVTNPFTKEAFFDYKKLGEVSEVAQKLMDDVVDLELEKMDIILKKIESDPEPADVKKTELDLWKRLRKNCESGRRTGLGITGLGDALAALGIRYGSDESIKEVEKMYKTLNLAAFKSSAKMARDRGAFSIYDANLEEGHPYITRIVGSDPELKDLHDKYGRRNIALTTTAPTGSVSILTQTTSGIEPAFLLEYDRFKKVNPNDEGVVVDRVDQMGDAWQKFKVYHHNYKTWMNITGSSKIEESPYYKATSNDVDWLSGVKLQAAAQKWICHSISRTANIPKNSTKELVSQIYLEAWKSGCKGYTVYRDGCRDGVLVASTTEPEKDKDGRPTNIVPSNSPKRPEELPADVLHATVKGVKWTILVGLLNGEPYEMFMGKADAFKIPNKVSKAKLVRVKSGNYNLLDQTNNVLVKDVIKTADSGEGAWTTRMMSMALRHGVPIKYLVDQLSKDGSVVDVNNVLARLLRKYLKSKEASTEKCPQCGSTNLKYEDGCMQCLSCGFSGCN